MDIMFTFIYTIIKYIKRYFKKIYIYIKSIKEVNTKSNKGIVKLYKKKQTKKNLGLLLIVVNRNNFNCD